MTVAAAVIDWREIEGQLRPFVITETGETEAVWAPQPGSQEAFMSCPAEEVCYESNRGCGKTDDLLMDFCQHVGQGWGAEWRGILFRQTYPQLSDVIVKSHKWFPRIWPGVKYNDSKHVWIWPTGETLTFSYGLREKDYWNYHGKSWPWLAFEELTTWADPAFFLKMFSCVRSTMAGMPRKIRATTNSYGCVPYGEVLTATRGWVDIQDIVDGELIVSVDQHGSAITTQAWPHNQKYSGNMATRKGRGLNMVFTEDHRLPHLNTSGSTFNHKHFYELPGQANIKRTPDRWVGSGADTVTPGVSLTIRKTKSKIIPELFINNYAALLGWMLSEGCIVERDKAFQISQSKRHNRKTIEQLLINCGFSYRKDSQAFIISEPYWSKHFKQFGKCRDKFIPQFIKNHRTEVLQILFNALMAGDGCRGVYYTTSKQLADDVADISVKLGLCVNVSSRQRDGRKGLSYAINTSPSRPIQLNTGNHVYNVTSKNNNVNVKKTNFDGQVYCLHVPGTQTFFIRQNGCVWLSSNSGHNWVKERYHLPVAPGEMYGPLIEELDEDGEALPERIAIHGYLEENRILLTADPKYISKIRAAAKGNKTLLEAWLYGSWDIVAGGMFDDVWDANRHVVPDFAVPHSWKIYRAFDWGSTAPFSVGWWAVSDGTDLTFPNKRMCSTVRGDLFRIGEWYGWNGEVNKGLKMMNHQIAKGIIERELVMGIHKRCKAGPADASIFKRENGICYASELMKSQFVQGKKRSLKFVSSNSGPGTRKLGWGLMRERFLAIIPEEGHQGPREFPGLFVTARCEQFRRTVPVLPRDMDKDPDDVDTNTEDHIGDESRYMVVFTGVRRGSGRVSGVAC